VQVRAESGALPHRCDELQGGGLEVLAAPVHGRERSGQLLDLLLCLTAVVVLVDGVMRHLFTSRYVPDGNIKARLCSAYLYNYSISMPKAQFDIISV
jgi:hypothetical protein